MKNKLTNQNPTRNFFIVLVIGFVVYHILFGIYCYVGKEIGRMGIIIFYAEVILLGITIGIYLRNCLNKIEKLEKLKNGKTK